MVRGKFIAPINFEFNLHRVTRGGERRIRGKLYEDFCPPRFVALIVDQILLPRCVASMLMDPYLLFLLQRKSGIRMARVDSPTTSVSQFSLSFPLPSPNGTTRKLLFREELGRGFFLYFRTSIFLSVFIRYKFAQLGI